jgi:hypothetical protein
MEDHGSPELLRQQWLAPCETSISSSCRLYCHLSSVSRRLQGSVEGAEASEEGGQAATRCLYARNVRVSCKRRVLKIGNFDA